MEDKNEKDEFFNSPSEPDATQEIKKRKRMRRVICVFSALLIAVAAFWGGWLGRYYSLDEEVRTFLWALEVSEKNYYKEIDEKELYEQLYAVLDLDPYSKLYSPDEYKEYVRKGQGQNFGVGVSLVDEPTEKGEIPRVFLLVENSPACRAGVRKGMYVLGFGESEGSLKTGNSQALVNFIGGAGGDFLLRCSFGTDGSDAKIFKMRRESYQAAFVRYRDSETSFCFRGDGKPLLTESNEPLAGLDGKTAYIRLDEFSEGAAEQFKECLFKMKERGREHLILDLRTNGGGFLDVLCEIAAHLMRNARENSPIVAKAVFRDGTEKTYRANGNDFNGYFTKESKVYVLADENTASASECLIGALVDYGTVSYENIYLRENDKGIAKTYGKGVMQTHFTNASGAAMKLTTAEIVWPSGRSIHGRGVLPGDGANPVPAGLIWGNTDPMLDFLLASIS